MWVLTTDGVLVNLDKVTKFEITHKKGLNAHLDNGTTIKIAEEGKGEWAQEKIQTGLNTNDGLVELK